MQKQNPGGTLGNGGVEESGFIQPRSNWRIKLKRQSKGSKNRYAHTLTRTDYRWGIQIQKLKLEARTRTQKAGKPEVNASHVCLVCEITKSQRSPGKSVACLLLLPLNALSRG